MTPFVLLGRKRLPPESPPSPEHVYDNFRQLWIDETSGVPLVSSTQAHAQASNYGETTMTETREGIDHTEVTTLLASQFGETTITKTSEGADQTERTALFRASEFGETTLTRTQEGADQTEKTLLEDSQFGETTLTNTREGADQTEEAASPVLYAPHSHF